MRKTIARLTVLGLVLAALPASVQATTGVCTVARVVGINNLNLPFQVTIADGLAMPVEFDETAGTFSMSRDLWSTTFGPDGAAFDTGFGPHGFIVMNAGTVSGTIDSSGNVTLPHFTSAFATDFGGSRSPNYVISPPLATTPQLNVLSGAVETTEGVPLDATGVVTMEGLDLIPDAFGAGGPILSGLRVKCTLSPMPNLAAAPPPPTFEKLSGKVKIGKALPATPGSKPDKGDVLTFKGRLAPGAGKFDFVGSTVFVRLASGGKDVVLLQLPAGKFVAKGTSSTFVDQPAGKGGDKDGTIIEVVTGRKENGTNTSAVGGKIKVVNHKGKLDLSGSVQGLDLSGLGGDAKLLLAVGSYPVGKDLTVSGGGSARKLK